MIRPASLLFPLLLLSLPLLAAPLSITVVDPLHSPIPFPTATLLLPDGTLRPLPPSPDGRLLLDAPPEARLALEADGFEPRTVTLGTTPEQLVVLQPLPFSETISVTASQSRVEPTELASAVSVVSAERLRDELRTSRNLADALGKAVPGLAPGSGSASIYGQTVRGRGVQVLVDGIPLTTLRNTARDLAALDPSMVERVDVVRGTTALYGDGATGGLINIVTRNPERTGLALETVLSTSFSPSNPSDSAGGRVDQSISGTAGPLDFRADLALERTGAFFDAEGDRIQPDPYGQGGLAESDAFSVAAKLGWNVAAGRRLQLALTSYESEQDTDWTTDPSVKSLPPRSVKSRPIRGLVMDHPQGSTNRMARLSYEDRDLFGSKVAAQAFARDYQTVFTAFDGRPYAIYGHQIFQSRLESNAVGLRLDVESPLPVPGLTLYWGADATSEETEQPVWIMDPGAFDASGGRTLRTVDDRPWVPLIDKQSRAAFAQIEWMASERWLFRGGVRYEGIDADIPTFRTLAGSEIAGGARTWSDALLNAGVTWYATAAARIWGGWSQGFSLPDIGLVLRSAPAGATLDTLPFQPQIVDSWEVGSGVERERWSGSIAAFYNRSDLGTSTAGFNQPVVRAPERVWGAEAELTVRPSDRWSVGGTFTWSEGESDPDRDGEYTWLNHYRIAPPNATFFLDHQTTPRWRNRVTVLVTGDRDRFPGSTRFGERAIEGYHVVDWLASFELPVGRLDVGFENVLNEEYFVRDAQLLRSGSNDSHTMAPGTRATLAWTIRY